MDNLNELLKTLGLEHQEAKVYLTALSLGTSPASVIGKRCGIPRSTARYTCEQLVKKQLMVMTQKGNAKLFTAENPAKLKKLLELQYETIHLHELKLDSAMQNLLRLYNPNIILPKVRFYEGVEGIISMFDDALSENKPLYGALSIVEDMDERVMEYLNDVYTPKRAKLKNPAKILFNDNKLTREYRKNDAQVNRISLLLPEKDFPFDVCCHIYGDKVAFYSYKKGDLTGVLIEDVFIKNTQLSIFKLAWNYARQLRVNEQNKNIDV